MRVFPINFLYNHRSASVTTNPTQSFGITPMPQLQCDTVSFGRTAQNAEPLRILMKFGMVDIWTGKPVIDPDAFETILKHKVFSENIKNIVRTLKPYKDTLHKVPLEIFEMLEEYAATKPNAKLDEIFQQWAPLAQRDILKIQMPIFKELQDMAKFLPESQKADFDRLMDVTKNQLQKKPISIEFNKKDFRYKLERIAQKIRQRNVSEEVRAIDRIIRMSKTIPQYNTKFSKNSGSMLNHSKTRGFKTKQKTLKHSAQNPLTAIRQVKSFFERSALKKDEELQSLFYDVNCQIHGIPTFIPFGRLNFIEELKKITQNIENKSLANRLIQIATKLPTATQESSAFIVKASRKPSEKIGFDLLWGSVGNIEHINAFSKGGKDGMSNYAVSTNYTNSERSNRSFAQQLRKHPEAYKGCQAYMYKLFEYASNGILKKVGLNNAYLRNFGHQLEKLSPSENPLELNLSFLY